MKVIDDIIKDIDEIGDKWCKEGLDGPMAAWYLMWQIRRRLNDAQSVWFATFWMDGHMITMEKVVAVNEIDVWETISDIFPGRELDPICATVVSKDCTPE